MTVEGSQGVLLTTPPVVDESWVWLCLTKGCHHRATFAVSDAYLCADNADKHARKNGHRVRITMTMTSSVEHWRADTDPATATVKPDAR